jgi:hypothetical protein
MAPKKLPDPRLPRHLFSNLSPAKQEAALEDLNRWARKHRIGNTASISIHTSSNDFHVFVQSDLDCMRSGALCSKAGIEGAAASMAPRRAAYDVRNVEMAETFLKRQKAVRKAGSSISDSDLKELIGKAKNLGRSAAIEAIDAGLRLLGRK